MTKKQLRAYKRDWQRRKRADPAYSAKERQSQQRKTVYILGVKVKV